MNKLLIVVLALLVMPTASAHVTLHFVPQHSGVPEGYCNMTYVEVRANITGPDDVLFGQFAINTDATCANITDETWGPDINTWMSARHYGQTANPAGGPGYDWFLWRFVSPQSNTDAVICNLTIHCNCSTCGYCISQLNFTRGMNGASLRVRDSSSSELHPHNTTLENGTVACGAAQSVEPFSKLLYEGWNLISLPLDPEDDTASAVLSGVPYDAVYQYNATSKQFEGIESADAMNPGTGYFVHATADCTWKYNGTAYNSMSTPLEPGLNMVGWLNCSSEVDDALSSISGDYYYVARWNTTEEMFEVYNPAAPSAFKDFTTMDRGTGCFISAKKECTLSESC